MTVPDHLKSPLIDLLLALADDKLFLGHRNSDWTGLGPILEEDIAFSHMAQDEIAHAQAIYEFIGQMTGKKADDIAFGRPTHEYRCASIVEVPDEFDWATAVARKFYCDHFDLLRLKRLANSSHKPLADLCARIAAEEQLHVDHVDGWMVRLGQGTLESRSRLQKAINALAPHATMLMEVVQEWGRLEFGLYPSLGGSMFDKWVSGMTSPLRLGGLTVHLLRPIADARGGRHGIHTPHFAEMIDEMCAVYRLEPGASW